MIGTPDTAANTSPIAPKESTNTNDPVKKKKHHHTRKNFKQSSSKPGAKNKWDSNHTESNSTKNNEQGPYVVIVKNAENDLSRIHHEALLPFLGLNKNQIKKHAGSSFYDLKIRSETRTAELAFFGNEEDKYFKTFSVHHGKENKITGKKRPHRGDDDKLNDANKKDAADDTLDNTADTSQEGALVPKYASVRDMLHSVSIKDYFSSPLHFNLLAEDSDERDTTEGKKANVTKGEQVDVDGEAETDGAVDVAASTADSQLGRVRYTAPSTRASLANGRLTSMQDPLVTSIADTSIKCTPKHLRKVLADVPGFVSTWFIRSCGPNTSTFRVVFESEEMLFTTKEILDQFGAERDMKITLKLSDYHEGKFKEFLVKKGAAQL